jgi:hypothetical protein
VPAAPRGAQARERQAQEDQGVRLELLRDSLNSMEARLGVPYAPCAGGAE